MTAGQDRAAPPGSDRPDAWRDKRLLITGGGRGIGRGMSAYFARRGAQVAIADRDAREGEALARELAAAGGRVRFIACDVTDEGQVREAVAAACAAQGETGGDGGLDGLVNNAGIMVERPLAELTLEMWRSVLDTNLTAAFLFAKHAERALAERGGAIVNVASTRATMSEPHTESYAASKGGLVALTHALAISLGPKVRVNAVSPGWIDVSGLQGAESEPEDLSRQDHVQHPAGRVGRAEDVAGLVAYLLGPDAGFVTGGEFVIDGGMTRKMIYS